MTIRTKNETSNGRDASERRPDTDIDQATPPAAALNVDVFVGSPDPNQVLVRFQNIVDGIVFLPVFVDEHWDLPASELGWMHSDWKSGSFVFDCLPSQTSEQSRIRAGGRSKQRPYVLTPALPVAGGAGEEQAGVGSILPEYALKRRQRFLPCRRVINGVNNAFEVAVKRAARTKRIGEKLGDGCRGVAEDAAAPRA